MMLCRHSWSVMVTGHMGHGHGPSWILGRETRSRGMEERCMHAGGGLYCVKVQVCVISTHSEYGVCVQMCEMCGVNLIRSKK